MGGFGPNRPKQNMHARWEHGRKKEEAQKPQKTNNDCNINMRTPKKRTRKKNPELDMNQQKQILEKMSAETIKKTNPRRIKRKQLRQTRQTPKKTRK